MLMYTVVVIASLTVAALTLFSGFGIGTLLMPVFALFFPVEAAIAMTAVVHLTNNIFKLFLVGRHADWNIALKFIVPGLITSAIGAYLMTQMVDTAPLFSYEMNGTHEVTLLKLVVSALILFFSFLELAPRFREISFRERYIPLGGALSGFFGGLSGHQGALRSAFLLRSLDDKTKFIGTGVVCAVVVDLSRLIVYGTLFFGGAVDKIVESGGLSLMGVALITAFLGSFLGRRLMKKVKMRHVRNIVGVMLFVLALLIGSGIL